MKYLNTPLLLLILFVTGFTKASGQDYTHPFPNQPDRVLQFVMSQGNLLIESYEGDEIIINGRNIPTTPVDPPERAKGLRSLFNGQSGNTGIGVSVDEKENLVRMISMSNTTNNYKLRVPDTIRLMIHHGSKGAGNIEISGHRGDIEVASRIGNIILRNITGPVNAKSISGDIDVQFQELNQDRPSSITSQNGYIDITLPETTPADLRVQTMNGGVYSDFEEIEIVTRRTNLTQSHGGKSLHGTINGGGIEIRLIIMKGDIFLRKGS